MQGSAFHVVKVRGASNWGRRGSRRLGGPGSQGEGDLQGIDTPVREGKGRGENRGGRWTAKPSRRADTDIRAMGGLRRRSKLVVCPERALGCIVS